MKKSKKKKLNGGKANVSKSVKDADKTKIERQKPKGNWDLWYDPYEHWHL